MPRFKITTEALKAISKMGKPSLVTTVDLKVAEKLLADKGEREAFRDAFHKCVNYGGKMPPRMQAALDSSTGLRYEKIETETFTKSLAEHVQGDRSDRDAYGGCRIKVGRHSWQILDTYGDEDCERGNDLLYTLCALRGGTIVVADIYYDPETEETFVRNEASGKVAPGTTTHSKRAFVYDPIARVVSLKTEPGKYRKIKVD